MQFELLIELPFLQHDTTWTKETKQAIGKNGRKIEWNKKKLIMERNGTEMETKAKHSIWNVDLTNGIRECGFSNNNFTLHTPIVKWINGKAKSMNGTI